LKKAIEISSPIPFAKAYKYGSCAVLVGRENGKLHLSISHAKRYPSWDEIKGARYELMPHDITVAMLLPPPEDYINVHQNCFHLWELAPDAIPNQTITL